MFDSVILHFHFSKSNTAKYFSSNFSRCPLLEDPYEQETVYVAQSKIGEAAGEGLYAKKHIRKGQLVCLFNGIRCNKTGHHTRITAEDEDWSDYRLTLGNHFLSWYLRLEKYKK